MVSNIIVVTMGIIVTVGIIRGIRADSDAQEVFGHLPKADARRLWRLTSDWSEEDRADFARRIQLFDWGERPSVDPVENREDVR